MEKKAMFVSSLHIFTYFYIYVVIITAYTKIIWPSFKNLLDVFSINYVCFIILYDVFFYSNHLDILCFFKCGCIFDAISDEVNIGLEKGTSAGRNVYCDKLQIGKKLLKEIILLV